VLRTASPSLGLNRLIASVAAIVLASAGIVHAQVVLVPPTPQIGSSNPITAEPSVPRPHTTPCIVPLFQELAFADFNLKSFNYTPPSGCPGPWAKVVFTADFTVTAGRQFDRTAAFYLGQASIYYGTTAEPRATLSPSWHVERDVTDLSAIFKSPQTGEANIGNFVGVSGGVTYNGIIYANAALEFYPASREDGAPRVPDIVVPVNGTGGDAGTLNTTTDRITQTLNLPTNVERVVLDVIAQSQSNDEFWYFCVPNDQTGNLESCGNTAFRETEVFIDGQPAGVAPVYPWIYTGGIDPFLWEPIPGVQTLDFKPYRVDLTPFAGVLSDGNTHTVSVGVFNADSYFLATANLLAFTDHNKKEVTGGIISNTLSAAPTPVVTENISAGSGGTFTGSVAVASNRKFAIRGYVNTSHGRVETTVEQSVAFLSNQQFNVGPTTDIQNAQQTSTLDSTTTTKDAFFVNTTEQHFSYPLTIDFFFQVNPDGTETQATTVAQKDLVSESKNLNGFRFYDSNLSNEVNATDTLNITSGGALAGNSGSKTTQTYSSNDSLGNCYNRTITAVAQALTSVEDGHGCKSRHNNSH
jgi:Peptide N-acetyl-beta-D-glucosaminyl asparaginase amidase A